MGPLSRFDVARFSALRSARNLALGEPLQALAVTGSTNDDALEAAQHGAAHGATFVADVQTRGRGRRGKAWFAAPAESLLCSVILKTKLSLETIALLALAAGLAVRAALERFLPAAEANRGLNVKWPNDVWVDRRKIAGVLSESHVQGGVLVSAVVGFGVNVLTREFPADLAATSTSLARCGAEPAREDLLLEILAAFDERVKSLEAANVSALADELSRYDALLGQRVCVDGVTGHAAGIDREGRLLLRTNETLIAVGSGSVEIVG